MPLRKWFRGQRKVLSVAVLPRRASCFRGELTFQLPADFRTRRQTADRTEFSGSRSGMKLTVRRMPFSVPVRSLTAADFQLTFRNILPMRTIPSVQYGFLRHSPTVTAVWRSGTDTRTLLHLIQIRGTVYLLLFTDIPADGLAAAESITQSAELRRLSNH